tara:strand:+ start:3535 stop:3789 length:255 start_codon:yes stop_codon:yes gene_type:complete
MTNKIYEIIGMNVSVIESTNNQIVGISGYVVDETKHMLTINTKLGEKLIPKNTCTLGILKSGKIITVSGSQLMKRSHERLEMLA